MGDESKIWDGFAENYDQTVRHFDRSYDAVRERLARDLKGCDRVLEVAAGTGQFTFALAEVAGHLTATDGSPEMVRYLKQKLADAGRTDIAAEVKSAYELGLDEESLDGLFCANLLHLLEHPERALAEFHRVLKPGGRLVLPTVLHAETLVAQVVSRFMTWFSAFEVQTRFDRETLEAIVSAAGFGDVEVTVLPGKLPMGYLVATCSSEGE